MNTTVHFFFPMTSETMDRIIERMQKLAAPGGVIANYDAVTATLTVIEAEVREGVARPVSWSFLGPMTFREAVSRLREELGLTSTEAVEAMAAS